MGWYFYKTEKDITPATVFAAINEQNEKDNWGPFNCIEYEWSPIGEKGLYGPGEGNGTEIVIIAAIKSNKSNAVFADVLWISYDVVNGEKGFWLKETGENMGPCVLCPPSVLDVLTPTESNEAQQWRKESKYYNDLSPKEKENYLNRRAGDFS